MANDFYNPYRQTPDWASGTQGTVQQIIQALLMKKMMGGQGGPPQLGETPVPRAGMPQSLMNQAQATPPGMPAVGTPQAVNEGQGFGLSPQQLQQLMMMLKGGGMGGGAMGGGMMR